jgi:hypothetical protein
MQEFGLVGKYLFLIPAGQYNLYILVGIVVAGEYCAFSFHLHNAFVACSPPAAGCIDIIPVDTQCLKQ